MKKILIAGSTGFVGKYLKKNLLNIDLYSIKTIDRDSGDYHFDNFDSIKENFDVIFVLFSRLPNKEFNLDGYMEVNFDLTKKLVSKFPEARFVFTSTISIYENVLLKPAKESDLGLGISDYAKSKLAAEKLFEAGNSIVLRLSSLYGPEMKETTFLPIVLNSALKKKEIVLIGDSSRKQNYTYIDDVIDFLIEAAESHETGIFNAVNDRSYSNEALALMIKDLLPETEIIKEESKEPTYSYEISNQKWLNCFNQGSKISLEEGLRKYLEYKRK